MQTSSFEAQFGRATGAIVNVVTKSGGNEFSGSVDGRYSSNKFSETGDFFDPKVTSTKNLDVSATLGGPLWKDRIWFFGNYQKPITEVQPTTTNAAILAANPNVPVRKFDGDNYGVKLSFTLTPSVTGFFNYQNSTAVITNQENSVLTRPEAAQTADQGGALYKGKLNAVAGQNLMLEVSGGRVGNTLLISPAHGDLSIARWTDRLTNVRYDSGPTFDDSDRPRTLFGASGTYFLSGALGNHQIKVGGDYDATAGDRLVFNTGAPSDPSFCPAGLSCGVTYTFNGFDAQGNRIPFQQNVTERQGLTARSGRSLSGYVQDQWRPSTQLTLNLGLRYDNSMQENTEGIEVINFKKVQPRVSAAYDILGDGRNVVRASYGWFYDEPGLTLVRLLQTGTVAPISRTYRWSTTQQRWNLINATGGGANGFNLVDPDIKPTYEEQINLAFERELFRNTRASFTYVYKKAHDIYEDSALDDEGNQFVITNRPGGLDVLAYKYSGYILEASHRFSRGLVSASYVYSKSEGSIDSSAGQFGGVDFDHNPENFKNRYGYLTADARHQVKIFAAYQIPFVETQLGVNYRFRTGLPYNITSTDPIWGAVF
ncbi:MAG: TonB-dependent receptor, partial [Acidobacteria bacterium]|nr:TonB-dependent receptor [Acidobacteriota bacterium]